MIFKFGYIFNILIKFFIVFKFSHINIASFINIIFNITS